MLPSLHKLHWVWPGNRVVNIFWYLIWIKGEASFVSGEFKFQNLTSVTISLLGISETLPLSTLVILVYLLGMVTGSALFGLVRNWIHGATRPPQDSNQSALFL